VIIPLKNKAVFSELPHNIKRSMKFHFVKHFSEVFEIMFPELAAKKTETVRPIEGAVAERMAS